MKTRAHAAESRILRQITYEMLLALMLVKKGVEVSNLEELIAKGEAALGKYPRLNEYRHKREG